MITPDMKVTGRFDDAFAAGARPLIEKLAQETHNITVDMSDAIDIDAAGLGALVYLHKRLESHGFKVRVVRANRRIERLFERFNLADVFIEGAPNRGNTALRSCFFGIQPEGAATAAAGVRKPEAVHGGLRLAAAVSLDAASHGIKAWLEVATAPGGELRGGDALKSYRRWAKGTAQDIDAAQMRASLDSILGPGRIISRTSGYVIRGVQLRRQTGEGR